MKIEKTPIEKLVKGLTDNGCKITFGIQKTAIEQIEAKLDEYDSMDLKTDFPITKHHMKFSKHFWDDIAKAIGWCPFTLALHYFRHLEKQNEND